MNTSWHDSRVAERVQRVASGVQRRFVRRGSPADPEDLFQEAALAALECLRSGKVRERENPMGYAWRAALCETGLASTRWLSPVSISEHVVKTDARMARRLQYTVSLSGSTDPEGELPNSVDAAVSKTRPVATPEEHLAAREAARRASTLRVLRRRRAERYLQRLPEAQREAVELMLGWDGRSCEDEREAARIAGITVRQVVKALARFRAMAWDDIELRRLHRRLEEIAT